MTNDRTAIVIVVDRLGCGYLGPYGNAWVQTPEWNRLASESLVCDFAISDSPDLETVYRSYWQGLHAARLHDVQQPCLAELLLDAGVDVSLVTDELRIAEHRLAESVSARMVTPPARPSSANQLEETQMARLFATAIEEVAAAEPPGLVWLHSQGMAGAWDAPHQFRQRFVAEDDPDPPEFVVPPCRRLEPDYDPDELLGISSAYAGQMLLLDVCLGALLDELAGMPRHQDSLLIVTSPRGFPLGEHLRIGDCDDALYGELVHVPWIVRTGTTVSDSLRSPSLVQPADLHATLLDWFGIRSPMRCDGKSLLAVAQGECDSLRQRACSLARGQATLRTPAWTLRSQASQHELYVRPDDRWEVNDIADRRLDVVAGLTTALDEFKLAAQADSLDTLTPLNDVLLHGSDLM